jgi:hypothetical protein
VHASGLRGQRCDLEKTDAQDSHLYDPLGTAVPFIKLAAENLNLEVSEVLPSEASVLLSAQIPHDHLTF